MKSVFPISRRDLLKSTGTIVAAATLAGCGSNGSDDGEVLSSGSDRLAMDPEVKIYHTTGAYNCGSRCQQKVHVKNGRIVAFTSAGDRKIRTPAEKDEADRKAEYDSSELGKPMELRACVRCYGGYQGLLYQPDKLKYPLIRDDTSKPKGDLSNFRRATWEEATDLVVEKIAAAIERSATDNLKYVPIMSRYFMWLTMARAYGAMPKPFLNMNGNESFGGVDQGTFDTVGLAAYINSRSDRYNTKFMITWALDVTRTTYWNIHTHFMNSKIKEGAYGTIPMVVISSTYSDAAAMLSTGVPDYTYTVNGASKTVDIPRFIACRPATDSCLAVAMIYVIYKNNRWSTSYMDRSTQASRKCFGFFAGDTVASQAPAIGSQHTSVPIVNPVALTGSEPFNSGGAPLSAGSSLTGFNFKVPPGESCEEYLKGLEVAWAGAAVDGGTSSYKYPQPSAAATPGDAIYTKVLEYAAAVTGVDPDVIEALAFKYSEYANHPTDAAFIETGGGPQRAWNAGEWVWSLIGLSAMCGYIPKKGGGIAGMSMSHFPEYLSFNSSGVTTPPIGSGGASNPVGAAGITIELCNWQHLVLTGKDHRDRAQIVNDVNYQFPGIGFTAADLPFKVDVIIHTNLNNIHTHPNTSKNAAAYKKVPTLIVIDQFMTPTARMADIILPATSHFELESYAIPTNTTGSTFIHREKIVDKLYDTKPEMEIQTILTEKLAARLGGAYSSVPPFSFAPFDFFSKEDYENVKITDYYKTYVQNIDLPTVEELKNREDGLFLLETSKDKPLLPMKDLIVPGNLDTSTGFLNFYSPLRAMRPPTRVSAGATASFLYKPGGWRNSTLSYQPLMQGREFYFDDANPTNGTLGNPLTGRFVGFKSPISGRTYKLQYMTNKSRNRGHTVFDSTAAIKDQFPQVVKMNPADAGARGIREGDAVYVYNDRGCMKLPANLSHSILPGIVSIEHGAWYRPHPTEKVKVWMQTDETEVFKEVSVPVDVGGADNILTNDYFGEDPVMCCGAVPAQAGPCEVSLTKPEDGGILI